MRFKYTQSGGKSQLKAGNQLPGSAWEEVGYHTERGNKRWGNSLWLIAGLHSVHYLGARFDLIEFLHNADD
jgi:hypothetical protein